MLVLEKEIFPRFHIGESLLPYNRAILDELGVTETLNQQGFPRKFGAQFYIANGSKSVKFVFGQGVFTRETETIQVERANFDHILLKNARAKGADCILLIARILSETELGDLIVVAERLGLEPLVEIATDEELDRALATPAHLIGVNARDLDTLRMDPERAARLVARIPPERIAIHLSGLASEDDVRRVAHGRADAALVGEALMRQDDPSDLLSRLTVAAAG